MRSTATTSPRDGTPESHTVDDHGSEALRPRTLLIPSAGNFPNNPAMPVLTYRGGFPPLEPGELETTLRTLFEMNGWSGCWRGDVYDFHHYHSNTHEVMGVCAGNGLLELGGPGGPRVALSAGDVLVLPAGTAHRKASASEDFSVLGAYPGGVRWDLRRGTREEWTHAMRTIPSVPAPRRDPVLGDSGGAATLWTPHGQVLSRPAV